MKKISLRVLVLAVLVSLLITFSFLGCSLLSSPKTQQKADGQSETTGSGKESGQESNQSSESQESAEINVDILSAFDNAVSGVADRVKPSVVNIKVTVDQREIFGNVQEGNGVGSGVIYSSDGYIITNNHVAGI